MVVPQTVEKLYYHPTGGVVRGGSPSDLKMRFSRACTAKTAPIKGWRGERRASESPYSQAKALEERFRLEACRLFRHARERTMCRSEKYAKPTRNGT